MSMLKAYWEEAPGQGSRQMWENRDGSHELSCHYFFTEPRAWRTPGLVALSALGQWDFLTTAPETGLGIEADPADRLPNTYSVCAGKTSLGFLIKRASHDHSVTKRSC